MCKKVTLLLIICTALFVVSGMQDLVAQSYQTEVNAGYMYQKDDSDVVDEGEINDFTIDATYNFEKVSLEGRPYGEAAFLQKASYVTVSGDWFNYKDDNMDFDSWELATELRYVFKPLPVFAGLLYEHNQRDGEVESYSGVTSDYERTGNMYGLAAGAYLMDGLAAYVFYARNSTETEYDLFSSYDFEFTANIYGINAKFVHPIGNEMSVSLEGEYTRLYGDIDYETDSYDDEQINNDYSLLAVLYVVPQIGITAGIDINRGDNKNDAGNIYIAGVEGYITPNLGLRFIYNYFQADDDQQAADNNVFFVGLAGRF